MAPLPSVTLVQVETTTFPPTAKPPGSANTLFLSGAGVRDLSIKGKFMKFTVLRVYLEDNAVLVLAVKWKGKTVQELADSVEFFKDIVTGPFEKFTQVTFIRHLTGRQYSQKVAENCIASWKSAGFYSGEEAKAIETFLDVFKDQTFSPGSSVFFTQSPPHGSLTTVTDLLRDQGGRDHPKAQINRFEDLQGPPKYGQWWRRTAVMADEPPCSNEENDAEQPFVSVCNHLQ